MVKIKNVILVITLLVLGVVLRVYNHELAMYFFDDQGGLLLIAHLINFHNLRPLAGPIISVPGWSIPPLNYYLVAFFEHISTDPVVVSLGFIGMNMVGSVVLYLYALRRFGIRTSLWTLALLMTSASMVEIGRSLWEPHPTFFFVALYLLCTEVAEQKRNTVLYGGGVIMYVFACALYPTPLLLVLFVFARAVRFFSFIYGHSYKNYILTFCIFLSAFGIVFGSWIARITHILPGLFGQALSVPKASFITVGTEIVSYINMVVYDVFQVWFLLPKWIVGRSWIYSVFVLAVISSVIVATSRKQFVVAWRYMVQQQYYWLLLGFVAPAISGFPMYAYRFIPFYPFIFLYFGRWIERWTADKRPMQLLVIWSVLTVFVVGNASSWYFTTINYPRRQFPAVQQMTKVILADISKRGLTSQDVGVHYFTPRDVYDYFASPLYYELHRAIEFPIAINALGNELDRSAREDHDVVYLVCDGFLNKDIQTRCVGSFLQRWYYYSYVNRERISSKTYVIIFKRFPRK